MHLFRVVPQSKYKQFFYNYASDLVGTGRLGLGLGLRAGVGVGVGHIINSIQQFAQSFSEIHTHPPHDGVWGRGDMGWGLRCYFRQGLSKLLP